MKRLDTIIEMIPSGARLADVGCDHAYVSISAVLRGAAFAYASDVREGPLSRAKQNIKAADLDGRIITALADGLDGAEKYDPDTVVIAGMGGELIARIIDGAPFVKNNVTLILQPMTSSAELRGYLISNGFEITRERLAYEDGRIYQIIVCKHTGIPQAYTEAELLTGKDHEDRDLIPLLYQKYIKKYSTVINGLRISGADSAREESIYRELIEKYENV